MYFEDQLFLEGLEDELALLAGLEGLATPEGFELLAEDLE